MRAALEVNDLSAALLDRKLLIVHTLDKAKLFNDWMPHLAGISVGQEKVEHAASVQLHGDYFATVSPKGQSHAVAIHTFSKHQTQLPFRKLKGLEPLISKKHDHRTIHVASSGMLTGSFTEVFSSVLLRSWVARSLMTYSGRTIAWPKRNAPWENSRPMPKRWSGSAPPSTQAASTRSAA